MSRPLHGVGVSLKSLEVVQSAGIAYILAAMNKHLISVLTTVNAPYSKQLDGATLAQCLSDIELAKGFSGQVSSFLGEVPVEQQVSFAAEFGIGIEALRAFAANFAMWTGESYKLGA